MGITKKLESLKYHIVDSTALLVLSNPIFCAFETMVAKMSDDVSINSRIYAITLTYAGLGSVFGKGRDLSRKLFKITEKTRERTQQIHDSIYLATIELPLGIGLYVAAGETDIKKIAIGTATGIAFGAFMGPLIGYAVDIFRDLTGLAECKRKYYPKAVQNLSSKIKKGLAVTLTAASTGAMVLIYALTPNNQATSVHKIPTQQTVIETNYNSHDKSLEQAISEQEMPFDKQKGGETK